MPALPNALEYRTADSPIEEIFLKRWSPRAMSGEPIEPTQLLRLFEAARWAPSTFNEQEWRFAYALRGSSHWGTFLNLLMEANQGWCANAGALIVAISAKTFARNGKPNPVHTLDTGMAIQNLLLQAAAINLVAHPMAGFNRPQTKQALNVPDDHQVECMIAVGHPGDPAALPEELQTREVPTTRKPVSQFAVEGTGVFPKS